MMNASTSAGLELENYRSIDIVSTPDIRIAHAAFLLFLLRCCAFRNGLELVKN
jgi:hypothetical protein